MGGPGHLVKRPRLSGPLRLDWLPVGGLALILLIPFGAMSNAPPTGSLRTPWVLLAPYNHPGTRSGPGLAYDAHDGYLLEFGGYGFRYHMFNDTWKFIHGNWTQLRTSAAPPGDELVKVAYDTSSKRVIYFGGLTISNLGGIVHFTPLNETWAYAGGNWTQLHPIRSPPPSTFGFLESDPALGGVVLFDNFASISNPNYETWIFAKGNWARLASATPSLWLPAGMAYDPQHRGMLLVGEVSQSNSTVETWSLSNGTWSRLTLRSEPTPAAINFSGSSQSMTYDNSWGFLVFVTLGQKSTHTWKLDHNQWVQARPPINPQERYDFGLAMDPADAAVVMFGGQTYYGHNLDQTWTY